MGSSTQVSRRRDRRPSRPASSPRTCSPGRSSASRSRSSRSVSVSTMVTGSVGVLLARTAGPALSCGESLNTSARRRRTNSAASAASRSATERSSDRDRVSFSVHRPIAAQLMRRSLTGCATAAQEFPKLLMCGARRTCRPLSRSAHDRHRFTRRRSEHQRRPQRRGFGVDVGGSGVKGGIVDLDTGQLIGERFKLATPQPATPDAVARPSPPSSASSAGRTSSASPIPAW